MNEEGKEVTVEFLMNHLAVEDGNTQHKFLSQINSSSSVDFAAYDHRQNRGKSNKPKQPNGRNGAQNKMKQPHDHMSTKWAPHHWGGASNVMGASQGVSLLPNLHNLQLIT